MMEHLIAQIMQILPLFGNVPHSLEYPEQCGIVTRRRSRAAVVAVECYLRYHQRIVPLEKEPR